MQSWTRGLSALEPRGYLVHRLPVFHSTRNCAKTTVLGLSRPEAFAPVRRLRARSGERLLGRIGPLTRLGQRSGRFGVYDGTMTDSAEIARLKAEAAQAAAEAAAAKAAAAQAALDAAIASSPAAADAVPTESVGESSTEPAAAPAVAAPAAAPAEPAEALPSADPGAAPAPSEAPATAQAQKDTPPRTEEAPPADQAAVTPPAEEAAYTAQVRSGYGFSSPTLPVVFRSGATLEPYQLEPP